MRELIGLLSLSLCLSTFVLVGCQRTTVKVYDKPGVTEAQHEKDRYECRAESSKVGKLPGYIAAEHSWFDAFDFCMAERGYTVKLLQRVNGQFIGVVR